MAIEQLYIKLGLVQCTFLSLAETDKKLQFFEIEKFGIDFFFIFFKTKVCNLVSNINDDCSQLSFEVYNVFVAQKLKILENAK